SPRALLSERLPYTTLFRSGRERHGLAETHLEKLPDGLSVESSGLAAEQNFAVAQAHGSEIADALSRWMMIHHGILGLQRDLHARSEEHTSELQSRVDLVCR